MESLLKPLYIAFGVLLAQTFARLNRYLDVEDNVPKHQGPSVVPVEKMHNVMQDSINKGYEWEQEIKRRKRKELTGLGIYVVLCVIVGGVIGYLEIAKDTSAAVKGHPAVEQNAGE
jgi:hypothetical protein